jgi:hypothetical protein
VPPIDPEYVDSCGSQLMVNPLQDATVVSLGPRDRFDPDPDGPPPGRRDRA